MPSPSLCERVRAHCADAARSARWVRIDPDAAAYDGGTAGLDPSLHLLDAPAPEVARYVLVLDAVNFGSGWFAELKTDTNELTARLTRHARARGTSWSNPELRAMTPHEVGSVLALDPGHELTRLYAEGLRQLGDWLGDREPAAVVAAAHGSADRLAAALAAGMRFYADAGFFKRAQITANDLHLAGVAEFADVDRLTAFADNLLPHVLRVDGVLQYGPDLASAVDAGRELPAGSAMEREVRACAVHACELLASRAGVPPRVLDNWLWNRGLEPAYAGRPAHRTRTVFY